MTVYVVTGYNGILNAYGVIAVTATKEKAEELLKEQEYMLDKSNITQHEVES